MRRTALTTLTIMSALIGLALTATSSHALNRKVEITNKTSFPLMNLYATRPNAADSRTNHLPTSSRIPAGQAKTIDFDDKEAGAGSCTRDLEFDLTGYTLRKGMLLAENVNICQVNKIVLDKCSAPGGFCATLSK